MMFGLLLLYVIKQKSQYLVYFTVDYFSCIPTSSLSVYTNILTTDAFRQFQIVLLFYSESFM